MEELHKIIKKKYKDFDITSQHLGQVKLKNILYYIVYDSII